MQNARSFIKPILVVLVFIALIAVAVGLFRRQVQETALGDDGTPTASGAAAASTPSDSDKKDIPEVTTIPDTPQTETEERSYDIVTLLPRDAIQSIDNPRFYGVKEADAEYTADELVLGVTINGESKAYSTTFLDSHEIVNDTLGGRAIAVTW